MSKNAASEELLGQLHQKVAKAMIRAVEYVEKGQDEYAELGSPAEAIRPELTPAMLSAMTKFLSDNSITANPAEEANTSKLGEMLRKKKLRVGNVVPIRDDD